MRIIQEHSEESLQIFLGDEVYTYGNVSLSTEVLAFVETIVITRVRAISNNQFLCLLKWLSISPLF